MTETTCAREGCQSKSIGRGLCAKHYQEARRAGTLPPKRPTNAESVCRMDGCGKPAFQRRLCHMHYQRSRRHGSPDAEVRGYTVGGTICSTEGCEERARAKGLCTAHYMRARRGQAGDLPRRPRRPEFCDVEGCWEPHHASGLCNTHYNRLRKKGSATAEVRERQSNLGVMCRGPECNFPAHSRGLCPAHYYQESKGKPLTPVIRDIVPRGTPCWVNECGRPSLTMDGICRRHYDRRLAGDPEWDRPVKVKAPDGAGHIDADGYHIITVDGKPKRKHVHLFEQLIGRPLLEPENVHHKNGNRSDNRTAGAPAITSEGNLLSGNLELWSTSQPAGQEIGPKLDWAIEMLMTYEDYLTDAHVEGVRAVAEYHRPLPRHTQVTLAHPSRGAVDVDWALAPLLSACWALGIGTEFSCQEGIDALAYVAFSAGEDLHRFRGALAGLADCDWLVWEEDESEGARWCVRFPASKVPAVTTMVQVSASAVGV